MAVEPKRRCGFRKIGGTYLEAPAPAWQCGRFPLPLDPCQCCAYAPDFTRTMKRVHRGYLAMILDHSSCQRDMECAGCAERLKDAGTVGLQWVGKRFYPEGQDFLQEWRVYGLSRRVPWPLPKWLEIGKTWILVAHLAGAGELCPECGRAPYVMPEAPRGQGCSHCQERGLVYMPAVIGAYVPARVVRVIPNTLHPGERARLEQKGLTLVEVPAGDPDHGA